MIFLTQAGGFSARAEPQLQRTAYYPVQQRKLADSPDNIIKQG